MFNIFSSFHSWVAILMDFVRFTFFSFRTGGFSFRRWPLNTAIILNEGQRPPLRQCEKINPRSRQMHPFILSSLQKLKSSGLLNFFLLMVIKNQRGTFPAWSQEPRSPFHKQKEAHALRERSALPCGSSEFAVLRSRRCVNASTLLSQIYRKIKSTILLVHYCWK